MSFNFYRNALMNDMIIATPSVWYKGIEQAFIDNQWDNTTSLKTIKEQRVAWEQEDYYQNFAFTEMEVWVNTVVGQSSTGSKTGYDFLQLIFKDINHPKLEGRYYVIDNEYYISYFDNRVVDVDANLSVRRCNQWMKIIDPLNGSIYQIPAVVDYDMSAPSNRVSGAIITPNNHAVVKVQQNAMTDRLFKTNSRFIIGNRPFKITGMQNATNQFINNDLVSSMDIDLFLDELWEQDNLELGLAYNGTYDYKIEFETNELNLISGSSGKLYPKLFLNGEETQRVINWKSSNEDLVSVDQEGNYVVLGEENNSAIITASLYGNEDVFASVVINIVDTLEEITEIYISPDFNSIKEKQTINFFVFVLQNGELIIPEEVNLIISEENLNYVTFIQNQNQFSITCLKRKQSPIILSIEVPEYQILKSFEVSLTSLLG